MSDVKNYLEVNDKLLLFIVNQAKWDESFTFEKAIKQIRIRMNRGASVHQYQNRNIPRNSPMTAIDNGLIRNVMSQNRGSHSFIQHTQPNSQQTGMYRVSSQAQYVPSTQSQRAAATELSYNNQSSQSMDLNSRIQRSVSSNNSSNNASINLQSQNADVLMSDPSGEHVNLSQQQRLSMDNMRNIQRGLSDLQQQQSKLSNHLDHSLMNIHSKIDKLQKETNKTFNQLKKVNEMMTVTAVGTFKAVQKCGLQNVKQTLGSAIHLHGDQKLIQQITIAEADEIQRHNDGILKQEISSQSTQNEIHEYDDVPQNLIPGWQCNRCKEINIRNNSRDCQRCHQASRSMMNVWVQSDEFSTPIIQDMRITDLSQPELERSTQSQLKRDTQATQLMKQFESEDNQYIFDDIDDENQNDEDEVDDIVISSQNVGSTVGVDEKAMEQEESEDKNTNNQQTTNNFIDLASDTEELSEQMTQQLRYERSKEIVAIGRLKQSQRIDNSQLLRNRNKTKIKDIRNVSARIELNSQSNHKSGSSLASKKARKRNVRNLETRQSQLT